MKGRDIQHWEVIGSQYAIDSAYYRVRRDTVRLPDGTIYADYFVNEAAGWATIFSLTADGKIILVRQYKHGIGRIVLELPAGKIEEGETPEEAIRRELEEETGYQVGDITFMGKLIVDPSNSTGSVWIYFAEGAKPTGRQDTANAREIVEVVLLTPAEVIDSLRKGDISVQGHVAAIYLVCDRLGLLRQWI